MSAFQPVTRITTSLGQKDLPEETPVALVYNGTTQAVMMATPADITDLMVGFTLTEGIAPLSEIDEVEILAHDLGIEARLWLPESRAEALAQRRRALVGAVGCGLCGIDSLDAAARALPRLPQSAPLIAASQIAPALAQLRRHQPLHDATHAVHAAALWHNGQILLAREDVGRHNALDKLVGAAALQGIATQDCVLLLTSRLSTEMVQKSVMAGISTVLSVSNPTAHAVRLADQAGLTLAATAGGLTLYTHPERITHD